MASKRLVTSGAIAVFVHCGRCLVGSGLDDAGSLSTGTLCPCHLGHLPCLTSMKLTCCIAKIVSEKEQIRKSKLVPSLLSSLLSLVQAEEFHPRMPTRRLAARASNSEDSHRSQSEAAADHPGPHTNEEAGGPGYRRRPSPCHWQPPRALESSSCKKDSEELAVGYSWKTSAGVSKCRLVLRTLVCKGTTSLAADIAERSI